VPFDDLATWLGRRKRRYVTELVGGRRPLVYNEAVDEVAGWLGRAVPDFRLSVGVLPVAGRWLWRGRPALLLCSEELRYDDEAFRRLAVEVVAVLVT
jgi:hypothetical protein